MTNKDFPAAISAFEQCIEDNSSLKLNVIGKLDGRIGCFQIGMPLSNTGPSLKKST